MQNCVRSPLQRLGQSWSVILKTQRFRSASLVAVVVVMRLNECDFYLELFYETVGHSPASRERCSLASTCRMSVGANHLRLSVVVVSGWLCVRQSAARRA